MNLPFKTLKTVTKALFGVDDPPGKTPAETLRECKRAAGAVDASVFDLPADDIFRLMRGDTLNRFLAHATYTTCMGKETVQGDVKSFKLLQNAFCADEGNAYVAGNDDRKAATISAIKKVWYTRCQANPDFNPLPPRRPRRAAPPPVPAPP